MNIVIITITDISDTEELYIITDSMVDDGGYDECCCSEFSEAKDEADGWVADYESRGIPVKLCNDTHCR